MSYLTDYHADAGDRIMAAIHERGCSFAANLEPAARLAGRQLELLKPYVFGGAGRNGRIYGGPAVMAPRGTMIVIMATERRVSTTHILPDPARNAAMEDIMERAEQVPEAERIHGLNS